jgi:hypothetical protein
MLHRMAIAAAFLTTVVVSSGQAEVIGPLLPRAAFEAGVQGRYVDRDVYYYDRESNAEQSELAIIGRWGLTEFATLSFELSPGSGDIVGGFDGAEVSYIVGGGIQATVFRNERVRASVAYQITTTLLRGDYPDPNGSTESHTGELILEGTTKLWDSSFTWFAGPAYSPYYFTHEASLQYPKQTWYSHSNFGGILGFSWVLWDHLNIASHVLWVENPQPRVAVLYRF